MDLQAAGRFWVSGYTAATARGDLTARTGEKPEVRLDSGLVDDPQIRAFAGGFSFSGSAVDSVAAFRPITLHGQLDSGEAVTVQHAQNYGSNPPFGSPHYIAYNVVVGDRVTGLDQPYTAVRFRLGHPFWLAHLHESEPVVVEDDGSTLSVEVADDGNWLVYSSSSPATLRQLEIRVVSGCLVLLHLVLDQNDVTTRETQVRLDGDQPWLPVYGPAFNAPMGALEPDPLLPREELTVERFAKWIPFNDKLDGLAWAVARPFKAELQPQVQVMTSLVEGLHRRLRFQQKKFPGVPKDAIGAVLKAARAGASAEAAAQGIDPQVASSSVVLFHDVSFRTRASDIVTEVCAVIPEITESIVDLPRRIVDGRNDFAHQLEQRGESLAVRILPWLIVANTIPWLLRGLLLLRAGVDPNVLRDSYLASNRFEHFRANTAQHVEELGWKLPEN
jgi:hypothetical protein